MPRAVIVRRMERRPPLITAARKSVNFDWIVQRG
jgi:hypothetical protein